jgi:hypothetical protein
MQRVGPAPFVAPRSIPAFVCRRIGRFTDRGRRHVPQYGDSVSDAAETQTWHHLNATEVFTAVTMKNGVFWDVTPCGSCKNRHFGGT